MYVYEGSWPLSPTCPCDVDFAAWMSDQRRGLTIFHFGTGGHHAVGIAAAALGNAVLGVTASMEEFALYQRLCIERPDIARTYKVLWGDAYIPEPRLWPQFDVVTLFHLCEWDNTAQRASYGALDDLSLARMLVSKLASGGRMLFYPGSLGWWRARDLIPHLIGLEFEGSYRSLQVHRRLT